MFLKKISVVNYKNIPSEEYVFSASINCFVGEEEIVCSLKRGQKKVMKCNGKLYERLADHIGKYPMVLISPSDRDLIVEGSETRR